MSGGLVRTSIFNAAAGLTMLVTGFICSIITARLLGPEANGIVAFAFWLTTTGMLVAGFGSDVLLPRMLPQLQQQGYDAGQRRAFTAYVAQFIIFAIIIVLAIYVILGLETDDSRATGTNAIAVVTGLLFVLQTIGTMAVSYLIGEQRPDIFFRLTIVASILQLVVTIVGALTYGAAGALAGYVASYAVLFLYAIRILAVRPSACGVKTSVIMKAALTISLGTIIESVFLNRVELAFLQHFDDIHTVGFYAVGLTLANLALQLPVQLSGSLVPYYTQLAHERGCTRLPVHLFENVIRIMAYFTLPMGFGLAAISTEVVTDVFGQEFAPAGTIVALLALSAPISVFNQVGTKYIYAIGKERARLRIGIYGSVTISLACLLLVPTYGGEGAAAARILMLLLIGVMMARVMDFEGSLRNMTLSLAKLVTAAATCAAVAYVTVRLIDGLVGTGVAILSAALIYFVMLRLTMAVPKADADRLVNLARRLPRPVCAAITIFADLLTGERVREKETSRP